MMFTSGQYVPTSVEGWESMRPATTLLLLLCLLGAGCQDVSLSFGGLDTSQLEAEIEAGLEDQTAGVDIESVDCPRGVQPESGTVFACRAYAVDGSIGTVEVQQLDDDGNVEWELTDVSEPAGPS